MIKFFRNIRKNLLNQGKTTKYFKYAVGEIVLVVIGILIALSLNNWNQDKAFKNELKQILKEVSNDLNKDIQFLSKEIKYQEEFIKNIDNLLNNGTKMPVDSLLRNISHVHSVTFFAPVNFGFNKLNKHQRTELLPDSLINNLTTYYTTFSNDTNNITFEGLSLYSLNLFRNYLIKYGFPLEMGKLERPKDVSNLTHIINDIEFIGILRNTKNNRRIQLSALTEARSQAENDIEMIDNYLSNID